jgi:uncharacterized membrane protein
MLRSLLIGFISGARSFTPLAAVSAAAWDGRLERDSGAPALLAQPLVAAGVAGLALAELFGDKMKSAPDRIVPAGMIVRFVTGALAGAAMAPKRRRLTGAAFGVLGATIGAHVTFNARVRAMNRWGQTSTGVVEDALTVGGALLLANRRPDHSRHL